MPPKSIVSSSTAKGAKNKDEKPKRPNAQQVALNAATEMAGRLYKQHERDRVKREMSDQLTRQEALLGLALEKERLRIDKTAYEKLLEEMKYCEELAYKECEKHRRWSSIPNASRLPHVKSESSINTFLSVWQDEEKAYDEYKPSVTAFLKTASLGNTMHVSRFVTAELGIAPAARRKMVESELGLCVQAFELTEAINLEADRSLTERNTKALKFFSENIGKVRRQVLHSLDFITIHALLGYDVMLEGPDNEFLTMNAPATNPVVKYGLWVKVKETTRSFSSLSFPNISISLNPRSTALPKLPRALGLSRENVAIRVIQLGFDPHAHEDSTGSDHYALNCVIKIDLLNFTERPRQHGDWLYRTETEESHKLHILPYPPESLENNEEDLSLRVSFEVPTTIVMRQPTLLIGKWLEECKEWELCSHTTPFADSNNSESRRCVFTTSEFATFAVLQEKGFDVPYEHWRLQPICHDQVLMVLEGHRRGEGCDREFRILLQDSQCKLMAPEDPELAYLRQNWLEPATLVRLLSQAGFNFILKDEDAASLNNIVPKSFALEEKAYADIAQFCLFFVIASSRHNKCGEDADLALFRISKQFLSDNPDDPLQVPLDDDSKWRCVRYQTQCCAFSATRECDDVPNLRIIEGHESHFNLYALLLDENSEEMRLRVIHKTNFLLRRCIFQLLCLVRPLTWG